MPQIYCAFLENTTKMKRQLLPLTTLRFVAAFMVVLEHIKVYGQGGGISVEFFFGLSGFILVYGYSKMFETLDLGALKQFFLMRIARLSGLPSHFPHRMLIFHRRAVPVLQGHDDPRGAGPSEPSEHRRSGLLLQRPLVVRLRSSSSSTRCSRSSRGAITAPDGKTATRIVAAWLFLLALRAGVASRFDTHVAYSFDWWFIYISP